MKTEAEVGVTLLHAREPRSDQALEEARQDSLSEPSEGVWPCCILITDICLQNCEAINSYCFKPPSLCTLLQQL